VDNVISEGDIITSLSQKNGKISYEKTKLLSSHVEGLGDFVEKKIEDISYNVENSGNGIISTLSQRNGKVEVSFKQIVSSDVVGLSEYVAAEIDKLDSEKHSEDKKFITGIKQENGVVSEISSRQLSSSDIFDLNNTIDAKINELDSSVSADTGKFITSVTQENGKLKTKTDSKVTDDFIVDETISESKIKNLTSDLENLSSNYVKRSGDVMTGKLSAPSLSAELLNVTKKYEDNHLVDFKVCESGVETTLVGGKIVKISSDKGLEDIEVNGESVKTTLENLSSTTYTKAEGYTEDKINALSGNKEVQNGRITKITWDKGNITSVESRKLSSSDIDDLNNTIDAKINDLDVNVISSVNKVIYAVSENDGKIDANFRNITESDFGMNMISQSKISNLVRDLGNISSEYLLTANFNAKLSSAFSNESGTESFAYDKENKHLFLDV